MDTYASEWGSPVMWRIELRGSFTIDTDEQGAVEARNAAKRLLLDTFELETAGTITVREDLYQRSLLPVEPLRLPRGQVHEAEHEGRRIQDRRRP